MGDGKNSTELAEDRTDLAEDRTLLANERTFGGWMRTGMAALGLGLAFNALFNRLEPVWFPKLIASLFIIVAFIIFQTSRHQACQVLDRMSASKVNPFPTRNMNLIAHLMSLGGVCLLLTIWLLDWQN